MKRPIGGFLSSARRDARFTAITEAPSAAAASAAPVRIFEGRCAPLKARRGSRGEVTQILRAEAHAAFGGARDGGELRVRAGVPAARPRALRFRLRSTTRPSPAGRRRTGLTGPPIHGFRA